MENKFTDVVMVEYFDNENYPVLFANEQLAKEFIKSNYPLSECHIVSEYKNGELKTKYFHIISDESDIDHYGIVNYCTTFVIKILTLDNLSISIDDENMNIETGLSQKDMPDIKLVQNGIGYIIASIPMTRDELVRKAKLAVLDAMRKKISNLSSLSDIM